MPRTSNAEDREDLLRSLFPPPDPNTPPTKKELELHVRYFIAGMFCGGSKSAREIAQDIHKRPNTISNVIRNLKRTQVLPKSTIRSGRPKKLNDRNTRAVLNYLRNNRRATAQELTTQLSSIVSVCSDTIKKLLNSKGYHSRVAAKKPFLKAAHRLHRRAFAKAHLHWTVEQWRNVIWTDESSFEIGKISRRVLVWRLSDERFEESCLVPTFKSGRTSIMVWGAICGNLEKCRLILIPSDKRTAADYVEYVYEQALSGYYHHAANSDDLILMEDGAPTHKANIPKTWRAAHGIDRLVWPAQSPDLNPIENVWRLMKAWIGKRPIPNNEEEMWELAQQAWDHVSKKFIEDLVVSMPARMKAVLKAKGGATRW